MGNYISCSTLSSAGGGRRSRATKVIFPSGEIRQLHAPTKAAELMLETPNFFLVNSESLHIGRRFSALSADEDLEMANVYVMFPMRRLNSVVTTADMGALFLAANSTAKHRRAVPESGDHGGTPNYLLEGKADDDDDWHEPKLNLDDIEEFSAPEFIHRLSMCRSKKPVLETIAEETVFSY